MLKALALVSNLVRGIYDEVECDEPRDAISRYWTKLAKLRSLEKFGTGPVGNGGQWVAVGHVG